VKPQKFLRLPEVLALVGLKRSAWYYLIQTGQAPRPLKLGRTAVWPETAIRKWQQRLIEEQVGVDLDVA